MMFVYLKDSFAFQESHRLSAVCPLVLVRVQRDSVSHATVRCVVFSDYTASVLVQTVTSG